MPAASNKPKKCAVCRHPDVARIDEAHAAGVAFDVLAEKYKIPRSTIHLHWKNCVGPEQKLQFLVGKTKLQQLRERAVEENMSVLDYLAIVRGGLMKVFKYQVEHDSAFGVSTVAARLIDLIQIAGRITGEIERHTAPQTTVNVSVGITAAPGFSDLMTGLLDVCRRHPDVRRDIIDLVDRLNGAPTPVATIEHEAAHA